MDDKSTRLKYNKCKYIVKKWEKSFKRTKGRVPSKLDIKEADQKIRNAYKMYFHLKTAALEESLTDVLELDGFSDFEENSSNCVLKDLDINKDNEQTDNVSKTEEENARILEAWGEHLNKSKSEDHANKSTSSVNLSFTQKLYEKSFSKSKKFKKNPNRSINKSFSETNSQQHSEVHPRSDGVLFPNKSFNTKPNNKSSSQPNSEDVLQSFASSDEILLTPPLVLDNSECDNRKISTVPLNICTNKLINSIQAALCDSIEKPIRQIDKGWLERTMNASQLPSQPEYDSDTDVISESEDEEDKRLKMKNALSANCTKEIGHFNIFKSNNLISEGNSNAELVNEANPNITSSNSKANLEFSKIAGSGNNVKREVLIREPCQTTEKQSTSKNTASEKQGNLDSTYEQRAKKRLQDKVASGSLNENFVTINLKKKNYARGKKHFNSSKYKKKEYWKKKSNMAAANRCNADKLIPIEEINSDDECVPTLDQAAADCAPKTLEGMEALKQRELINAENESKLDKTGPLYQLNEDGSLIDTPQEVYNALNLFGFSEFRPGQEKAIMRILSGLSTVVTLSTGSGKSLCYQLPAYLYTKQRNCIILVISPLVSLMEDQVSRVAKCLNIACWHNNQTEGQRKKVLAALEAGNLNALLVSPEMVAAGEKSWHFNKILGKMPPIAFVCIDEAHCVSQWSHNFRPAYLMIGKILKEKFKIKTILALTATATVKTRMDIVEHFNVPDGINGIIRDTPIPDNLILNASCDPNRDEGLIGLLESEPFNSFDSIIVYCTRRDEADRLAILLRTLANAPLSKRKRSAKGSYCESYHAGLSAAQRKRIQKAFMTGALRIVVATIAFGMGINKADIRAVIHYNMPKCLESYVQEVGRAGRDGKPAYCHLFLDSKGRDQNELRRFIYSDSIDRATIRKILQRVFLKCHCTDECLKHEVAFSVDDTTAALDSNEEVITTILCYLELHEDIAEVLPLAYTQCEIGSYRGAAFMHKTAEKCPLLRKILEAYPLPPGEKLISFPIVKVASDIGIESGFAKKTLKDLEYYYDNGQFFRSGINVGFDVLGFRVKARGNLTEEHLDATLDSIYERVMRQEKAALLQLQAMFSAANAIANKTFDKCYNREEPTNDYLKTYIRNYFEHDDPLSELVLEKQLDFDEGRIRNDVRELLTIYSDNQFTGRAVARIFQGIQSPNYPAYRWASCKLWRKHVDVDFTELTRLASEEIFNVRTGRSLTDN